MAPDKSNLGRRNFLQMTGAGIVAVSAGANAARRRLRTPRRIQKLQRALRPSREGDECLQTASVTRLPRACV
jgi:hypothetical protein